MSSATLDIFFATTNKKLFKSGFGHKREKSNWKPRCFLWLVTLMFGVTKTQQSLPINTRITEEYSGEKLEFYQSSLDSKTSVPLTNFSLSTTKLSNEISKFHLQTYSEMFDTAKYLEKSSTRSLRRPRSVLSWTTQCFSSKDNLTSLKNGINNVLSKVVGSQNSCELFSNVTKDCNEIVNLIQCGINRLDNGFLKTTNESLSDVIKRENAYKILFEKSLEEVGNIQKLLIKDHWFVSNKLKLASIQELTNIAVNLKELLIKQKSKLCIFEITNSNIKNAIEYYKELENSTLHLPVIIEEAYTQEDNLPNVIKFIYNLHLVSQKSIGYKILVEKIAEKGQLTSSNMIIMDYYVKQENYGELKGIKQMLTIFVDNVINDWIYRIHRYNYWGHIKLFAVKYPNEFSSIIDNFIRKFYGNNVSNAGWIIKNFPKSFSIQITAEGFISLYSEMERNQHLDSYELVQLAYAIKKCIEITNLPKQLQIFNSLYYTKIPRAVRTILSLKCMLKNKKWDEYLYAAANDLAFDYERRRVFTWRPGDSPGRDGHWLFESEDGVTFRIKNMYYHEYLYAAYDNIAYDSIRRRVFTWRPGYREGSWKIKPMDNGRYITLLSTEYNEYLYPDGMYIFNGRRRNVFTYRRHDTPTWFQEEHRWAVHYV